MDPAPGHGEVSMPLLIYWHTAGRPVARTGQGIPHDPPDLARVDATGDRGSHAHYLSRYECLACLHGTPFDTIAITIQSIHTVTATITPKVSQQPKVAEQDAGGCSACGSTTSGCAEQWKAPAFALT